MFESAPDDPTSCPSRLTDARFELVDGHNPDPGPFGQIVLDKSMDRHYVRPFIKRHRRESGANALKTNSI